MENMKGMVKTFMHNGDFVGIQCNKEFDIDQELRAFGVTSKKRKEIISWADDIFLIRRSKYIEDPLYMLVIGGERNSNIDIFSHEGMNISEQHQDAHTILYRYIEHVGKWEYKPWRSFANKYQAFKKPLPEGWLNNILKSQLEWEENNNRR